MSLFGQADLVLAIILLDNMSKEHHEQPLPKIEQFELSSKFEQKSIAYKFMTLAVENGYKICKPKLRRPEEETEEKTTDDNGTIHIIRRVTLRPPDLDEYVTPDTALQKWQNFGKEFLIQKGDRAYLLATDHQIIGPFHPLDSPELIDFICIGIVPILKTSYDRKQEKEWLAEAQKQVPKPSHERFRVAQIENKAEGLLIEIQDRDNLVVTLNSKDDLLKNFTSSLKKRQKLK